MNQENKRSWKCIECRSKQPKTDNTNTPVRASTISQKPQEDLVESDNSENSHNITHRVKIVKPTDTDNILNMSPSEISDLSPAKEMRLFWCELRAVRNEMVQFNSTLSELTAVMNKYNERIDYLEAKLESLEVKQIDKESNRIEHLETTITQLKLDLQDREQEMLSNDVEIAGIPEVRNENLMHVTFTVAKKLTVEIEDRDIMTESKYWSLKPFNSKLAITSNERIS
ncbi:unnamed protein product [Parnassius apollo]|uniref:(apollo) hypothetical protein n=1 Tax=Parnassius apollo TaxID=110799 RepID=A0A8S3WME7_PARAO|nr:unnamed protein product [Parnassius apollo]